MPAGACLARVGWQPGCIWLLAPAALYPPDSRHGLHHMRPSSSWLTHPSLCTPKQMARQLTWARLLGLACDAAKGMVRSGVARFGVKRFGVVDLPAACISLH